MRTVVRGILVAVVGTIAVTSCSSDTSSVTESTIDVPSTVDGVGSLPPLGLRPLGANEIPNTFPSGATIPRRDETIGEVAEGSRLLMIGDSIFAALSRRVYNTACPVLTPLGWDVLIEAEIGRSVEFGLRVLSAKLNQGWDVAAVNLGTNYWRDQDEYRRDLEKILDRLAPRPTILFSVTEWRPEQREVNEVIADQVLERDNVWFVYWRAVSETPGVLSSDDVHPSDEGNDLMVSLLAEVLGDAPGGGTGRCLESEFVDDDLPTAGYDGPRVPDGDADSDSDESESSEDDVPNTTVPGATTTLP